MILFSKVKNFFSTMKAMVKFELFSDWKLSGLWLVALLFNGLSWGVIFWLLQMGSSVFILHYNAYLGIDALINFGNEDPWQLIFVASFVGLMIWLINFVVASIIAFQADLDKIKKEKDFSVDSHWLGHQMVVTGNLILQVAILIYVASIVLVNRF